MSVRWLKTLMLVLVLLAIGSASAIADVFSYAVATDQNLYLVDLTTANATVIGSAGAFLEGLALSPGGSLFGTDVAGNLYSLNKTTGAATFVGATGRGNIEGLDFSGSTLLGTDFNDPVTVFSINTSNASTANIVTASSLTGVVRTMTVLDPNNVLVRGDGPPNNTLYSLSLTTGAVTTIGTLAVNGFQFAAMDFGTNGVLYGLDNDGSEWIIDPTTAGVTLVGNTGGQFWLDMTAAPVPEPGTITLLGLGLLALRAGLRRYL